MSTVDLQGSVLAHCAPVGGTQNLALVLHVRERDEYWLRVIGPDSAKLSELGPLDVSDRIRACNVTLDGSTFLWYDSDLRAIALDGSWERRWRMEGEQLVSIAAPDPTAALVCRLAEFPTVVSIDLVSGKSDPMEVSYKAVTQMVPMLTVDSGWQRAAFGYVLDALVIWNIGASDFSPWPTDVTDPRILAGSPFIASLQFDRGAERILVSSGPDRDGGPVSHARVGSVNGESVRVFDTTPLRKRISTLPDLSVALSTSWEASGQILALDLESGAINEVARVDFVPRDIVITRDGRICYVVNEDRVACFALDC